MGKADPWRPDSASVMATWMQDFGAPADLQRRALVVYLAAHGVRWSEIQKQTGIFAEQAKQIVRDDRALPMFADVPAEVRRAAYDRLAMDVIGGLHDTFRHPGYVVDVKGSLVRGPDGQYLEDTDARIKAGTAIIKAIESQRRLHGIDAPARRQPTKDENELDEQLLTILGQVAETQKITAAAQSQRQVRQLEHDTVDAEIVSDSDDEVD
jgi:hypothetical protein